MKAGIIGGPDLPEKAEHSREVKKSRTICVMRDGSLKYANLELIRKSTCHNEPNNGNRNNTCF